MQWNMSCCSVNSFDFALQREGSFFQRLKSNELTEQQDLFCFNMNNGIVKNVDE